VDGRVWEICSLILSRTEPSRVGLVEDLIFLPVVTS
jgi:hypothetical protein